MIKEKLSAIELMAYLYWNASIKQSDQLAYYFKKTKQWILTLIES